MPGLPGAEIQLQAPPVLAKGSGQSLNQLMFMLPMMLGMGAMSFFYMGDKGGAMTYVFAALYGSTMIGMILMSVTRGGAQKKAQINNERRDYHRYLGGLRQQVREVAAAQRTALSIARPEPTDLWLRVAQGRHWERRRTDDDFGHARVGRGPQRLATPLRAPQTAPLEDLDPVSSAALRQFIRTYMTVPDLPVALSLRSFGSVALSGDREAAMPLVRALIGQLVTFHAPEDLRVALCVEDHRRGEWEWLKWLPHAQAAPGVQDAVGSARLVADNLERLGELLDEDMSRRPAFGGGRAAGYEDAHILVIVDGGRTAGDTALAPASGRHGVTVLELVGPEPSPIARPHQGRLHVVGERMGLVVGEGKDRHLEFLGHPDAMDPATAEALARRLAGAYQGAPTAAASPMAASFGLPDLLGIGDPEQLDPARTWLPRAPRDRLRIPIGMDPEGRPLALDLKEAAEDGMGPHGLVIGATGSGKSELLRTLVAGLVATHSSETLNLALVDFKGGATFAGMSGLPHVCAVITNLSEELTLVDRMADAINGEVLRRQEMLRAAGNYASVRDYERARERGADLTPLPALLVIIDEFSELLSNRPELIDLFVMIGRLGRSLAIHLLLASQRLEEGRLRGLDAHLSYRIGLRTFSAAESRAVLGVPDAYQLPSVPGSAYLKTDTETLLRFKAAYVSGPMPTRGRSSGGGAHTRILPFTLSPVIDAAAPPVEAEPDPAELLTPAAGAGAGPSIMDAMVARLVGAGPAAHQIWLPPLDEPVSLEAILPPLGVDGARGLCPVGWGGLGRLTVPSALVDKPFEQRRDLLWTDLSGAAGHVMVIGGPQSGKSTLVRTLISVLALTHTPEEVQFLMLDTGGGALGSVAGLPHVSGYATRRDGERVRRIVGELTTLLAEREQLYAKAGVDSAAAFRARRAELAASAADGRAFGDVFLVVDDWTTLRQEYEQLEEPITALAARGLGFGIHVVITTNRVMTVRPALRDTIGTRLELRLGDPGESLVDRRVAANVPSNAPGRGLTPDKLHFLGALPRIDGGTSAETLGAGTADLVAKITAAWPGAAAPQVRMLPQEVSAAEVRALLTEPRATGRAVPFGLSEADLQPVFADFDADPHFIAFGDVESGKSGLLRTIAAGIMADYTPEQAAIAIVDYRRALLDAVTGDHLLGYAGSEPAVVELVNDCAEAMRRRLPGPDVTPEQLRERSWWKGPELFVIVDDYELVAVPGRNPLAPLLDYLAQARDIGLHLVIARGSGGAGRGLFEPVLQRLRELGSPGLVMSGSKDEGALLGTVKPGPQPAGRGVLVHRRAVPVQAQVAWTPPAH
ncbi:type VII secretion protein EccCa [Catenulispora subtropica]|uniref:Type VII secretion protein EccC n=1 Tax=Catenulispora subtropica TaxID=450798 RepID=A0ABP5EFG8_9ACTN